jgi:imidazolonepropionase-like amidohydrolase
MHFTVLGRPASLADMEAIKSAYLRHGVLEVKDMGNRYGAGFLARKILGDEITVKSCGYALFKQGTYGAFLGKGVAGVQDITKEVEELYHAGADFIKVINSGIVSAAGERLVTEGGFNRDELSTLCEEAGERGLEVACHANSDSAVRDAVNAGVSSIEHGFFVSEETLHMMAEKGVSWTPTALALLSVAASLPHEQASYLEEVVESHLAAINMACAAGVWLRIGTDSGSREVAHGESFIEELRLFAKAGLSLKQILSAACGESGRSDHEGCLLVKEDFIATGEIMRGDR